MQSAIKKKRKKAPEFPALFLLLVMAGFGPAIHLATEKWMAGSVAGHDISI
jgi:hypothetical protein